MNPADVRHLVGRAGALAASGRVGQALALLDPPVAAGEPEACFMLAAWLFEGSLLPRNLARARILFGRAGEHGHMQAASIHAAFLAQGTGGPVCWLEAVALLTRQTDDPGVAEQLRLIAAASLAANGDPIAGSFSPPRRISNDPRIIEVDDFFTEAECAYLIARATPLFEPSVVIDPRSGRPIRDDIRRSHVASFPLAFEEPAMTMLNKRIAYVTGTRPEQGEPLQVLRYRVGDEYRPHLDTIDGVPNQRVITALIYLDDVGGGGETVFPSLGLSIAPRRGKAIYFRNVDAGGFPDIRTRHAGRPVSNGVKHLASRWIRQRAVLT